MLYVTNRTAIEIKNYLMIEQNRGYFGHTLGTPSKFIVWEERIYWVIEEMAPNTGFEPVAK